MILTPRSAAPVYPVYPSVKYVKTNEAKRSRASLMPHPKNPFEDTADLKKAGLKATLPRLKILRILEESSEAHHLTAEDVYKHLLAQGEEVGLATVYRVLTQFETAGLVIRHNFEGGRSVFEINHGA